tara:strand:+ start:71 stop:889 length:819 start_codon:yes stop_codon:yes gene_type:complete
MKTYSVLSYNRTGSTVVGQMLAGYFGKEYQAEITNIPSVLMRYDENGNDVNVEFVKPLPKGTYAKTYNIQNGVVTRLMNYDNPKPFAPGTPEFNKEVSKRKALLQYNAQSKTKSIFKIQPQTFTNNFIDYNLLDGYTFIFCARRDIREQILSYLIAMNTKLFHIGYNDHIVNLPNISITKGQFKFCMQGLRDTNFMFEYFKNKGQIENIIYYEDWHDDTHKILPSLGFKHTNVETFKKIKYSVGQKNKLVNNIQEVYDWMDNEPEFNYSYRL